jgi:hypothetical protein
MKPNDNLKDDGTVLHRPTKNQRLVLAAEDPAWSALPGNSQPGNSTRFQADSKDLKQFYP